MENRTGYLWHIRLFGGPTLESSQGDGNTQSHFRSSKVAALLGYLALNHGRPCTREALTEALWPEEPDFQAVANRFRVTLASLRRQLEPQGFPFGSVLDTSIPGCISLSEKSVWCDVTEFEYALSVKDKSTASNLLNGPLLPTIYDDWAAEAQLRYALLRDELAGFRNSSSSLTKDSKEKIESDRHRLPLFLSRFFAREKELNTLKDLIENHRLVTITGPGGVGKTRLSVECCKSSPVQTVFVPLADCSNRDEIAEAIIRHLSVHSQIALDPVDQLLDVLDKVSAIRLLLDNVEHLIEEAVPLIESLLESAPGLRLVLSSRQGLEIMGEQIFRLHPLDIPGLIDGKNVSSLSKFASTTLFLDRVRQSRPDFVPTEVQVEAIVEICRRLEGLPLGIELAAAQITVLSISSILEKLESSLIDLKSQRRSLSVRHRSLRAAIESSLDGLDEENATFLSRLSVFWGGWTVEHAEVVTGNSLALERLEELTIRSLVSTEIQNDSMRFQCLEVVRQLAQETLGKSELAEMVAKHSAHFLHVAGLVDENNLRTLHPLDSEMLNLTVAFQNADPSDPIFWNSNRGAIIHAFVRGQFRTGLKWFRDFGPLITRCQAYEDRREWRIAALHVLPDLGLYEESKAILESLREDAIENDDRVGQAYADISEGLIAARIGDFTKGVALHRKAVGDARKAGNSKLLESALAHLSGSLHEVGRIKEVSDADRDEMLREAESMAIELIGMVSLQSRRHPLAHLLAGVATFYLGRFHDARTHFLHASNSAARYDITTVTMYSAFFESEIARQENLVELANKKLDTFQKLRDQTGIIFGTGKWN